MLRISPAMCYYVIPTRHLLKIKLLYRTVSNSKFNLFLCIPIVGRKCHYFRPNETNFYRQQILIEE